MHCSRITKFILADEYTLFRPTARARGPGGDEDGEADDGVAGGRGHEAHDAGPEGGDPLHHPLQRCLQRGVQGGRARWRCSKVAFLCFLI